MTLPSSSLTSTDRQILVVPYPLEGQTQREHHIRSDQRLIFNPSPSPPPRTSAFLSFVKHLQRPESTQSQMLTETRIIWTDRRPTRKKEMEQSPSETRLSSIGGGGWRGARFSRTGQLRFGKGVGRGALLMRTGSTARCTSSLLHLLGTAMKMAVVTTTTTTLARRGLTLLRGPTTIPTLRDNGENAAIYRRAEGNRLACSILHSRRPIRACTPGSRADAETQAL